MMRFLPFVLVAGISANLFAQTNYDENKVPKYKLPDPLVGKQGKVRTRKQWITRRAEILELFTTQVYGRAPQRPKNLKVRLTESGDAFGGLANRKQITIPFTDRPDGPTMNLLMYIPKKSPAPVFLGLNFNGNHTIVNDPKVPVTKNWVRGKGNRASEKGRGSSRSRWSIEYMLKRGYGIATIYYGDIDPDFHDGFKNGVHPLFYKKGQKAPAADEWGSIAAWAWGLSLAMDYLQTDRDVDVKLVAVMGHSRLGKTALWAGATDQRFALVVSNNSGCGGAALSRRAFGETVKRINTSFPHWFNENFKKYNDRESRLPVDQHMLIALMAPRPVMISSAEGDRWADPRGEFLAAKGADGVYRLLGTSGFQATRMPAAGNRVFSRIGYNYRPGNHDVKLADWKVFANFADKHMK